VDRRELYTLTGSIVRIAGSDAARPDAGVHLFTVESAAGTTAVLRPCDPDAKQFAASLPAGAHLRLTVGASDGVFEGTLTVDRWLVSSRMLMVNNPPLTFAQRRSFFRVPVNLPIELGLVRDGTIEMVAGITSDISQGGCSVVLRDPVIEGELAAAFVHLDEVVLIAVVQILCVVSDRRMPVRVRFDQITPFDRSALATELRRYEVARVRTAGVR
jgi:PilZ domain